MQNQTLPAYSPAQQIQDSSDQTGIQISDSQTVISEEPKDPLEGYKTLLEKIKIMNFLSFAQRVEKIKSLIRERKITPEEARAQLKEAELSYDSQINESSQQ